MIGRRRGEQRTALTALLLAIGLFASQLLALGHDLFAQHAACPVHAGELIDLPSAAQPTQPVPGLRAADTEETIVALHADHCLSAGIGSARALTERPILAEATPVVVPSRPVAPARATPPSVPLLDLAPKSSPPSA